MKHRLGFQIGMFTAIRVVLNTMHRMIYPFLSIFAVGLGVDLGTLSLALTSRALIGASGPFLARISDVRGRKIGMLFGLLLFTLGVGLVAIWPGYLSFLLALILTLLGKYVFDPAMQAYLGDRVPYERRGRVLAITEMGWSLGFILGVPLMGFLIAQGGWTAPFPVLAVLGIVAILVLAWLLPPDPVHHEKSPGIWLNLGQVLAFPPALAGLAMGLLVSTANEVVNLVFGVWLQDSFSLKITALGVASAVIGFSELGREALTATLSDRIGKTLAIASGLILNSLAALALPFLGYNLGGALVGLFLFYITFEFALVSSIPLMTEVFPSARATMMAAYVAGISLGRALGALLGPSLYSFGEASRSSLAILPSTLTAVAFNLLALLALYRLQRGMRRRPETSML